MDEQESLLNYLGNTSPLLKRHLALLKIETEKRIYQYGEHFKHPVEYAGDRTISLRKLLIDTRALYSVLFCDQYRRDRINVMSLVYFNGFKEHLSNAGINLISPFWTPIGRKVAGDKNIIRYVFKINKFLKKASFNQLLSDDFQKVVLEFETLVYNYVDHSDLKGLFLYTGEYFYSKVAINAFKSAGKPSFILSHGLPGIYNCIDMNADYLLVWGERIKENYIKAGFDGTKILVSGHPSYAFNNETKKLKFGLSDILVLAKGVPGYPHDNVSYHYDRGGMIIYLLQIKQVLKQLGVKSVRLRPHPSMNGKWLLKYLDNHFFHLDRLPLSDSLNRSSLVIGGVSTVLLESVLKGINYIAFEPADQRGRDLLGFDIVPPFDGSDENIPVAKSATDLLSLIKNKTMVGPGMLKEYLSPFDVSFTEKLR